MNKISEGKTVEERLDLHEEILIYLVVAVGLLAVAFLLHQITEYYDNAFSIGETETVSLRPETNGGKEVRPTRPPTIEAEKTDEWKVVSE